MSEDESLWKTHVFLHRQVQLHFMVSRVVDSEGILSWAKLVTEATLKAWAGHVSGLYVPGDAGPVFGSEVTLRTLKLATAIIVDP